MKKLFVVILIISLIATQTIGISYGSASSKYKANWETCIEENTTKNGDPWKIDPETEFLCPNSQKHQRMLYNIVLDDHFKPIDTKAEEYIQSLEENKDHYFGPNRKEVFLKAIDENANIFSVYGLLYNEYSKECDASNPEGILQDTVKVLGGTTSIDSSKGFFSQSTCIALAEAKLNIWWKTAQSTLQKNKATVRSDSAKLSFQKRRSAYELVIDLFSVSLGYLLRLSQKWPSKTKNPY